MIVIPTPIPILIQPMFWLMAGLIGWIYSQGGPVFWIFIWMLIVFVSVLFHELGHAITASFFKQKAKIQLLFLGGLTSYEGPKLSFFKQFLIVLNGPIFGILLCIFSYFLLSFVHLPILHVALQFTWKINLFWSIANLLPIMPLDGGHLLRIALEGFFGVRGFRIALIFGAGFATFLAFFCFVMQQILLGAFLFFFAFQSYDTWRKSRYATTSDRDEENREILIQAERALQEGRKEEAKRLFEQLKGKSKEGLFSDMAAQYMALLFAEEGKRDAAYELLLPIAERLAEDTLCLLHQLAAERKNYPIVAKLSTQCYQIAPNQEMALSNARAFAYLHEAKLAGGWLQSAYKYGGLDLKMLLLEEEFAALKNNHEFQQFIEPLE